MIEDLLSSTALPNLHPAVIHFPIALVVTAFGFDLAAIAFRGQTWIDRAAAALWTLAALGSIAGLLTGKQAASTMWDASGAAQAVMADHEDLGTLVMIIVILIAGLRGLVAWLARADERTRPTVLRIGLILAAILAQLLLIRTADLGGSLVYQHGLGVTPTLESQAPAPGGS